MPRKKTKRGFRLIGREARLARMTPDERAQDAIASAKVSSRSVDDAVRIGRALTEAYASIGKTVGPDDPDPELTKAEVKLLRNRFAESIAKASGLSERSKERLLAQLTATELIGAADAIRERAGLNRRKTFADDPWSDWHPRSAFMRAVDDWKRANGKGKVRLNITDWWARVVETGKVDFRQHDSKKRLWSEKRGEVYVRVCVRARSRTPEHYQSGAGGTCVVRLTPERKRIFLDAVRQTGSLRAAAALASPHSDPSTYRPGYETFRDAARRDPAFAQEIREALNDAMGRSRRRPGGEPARSGWGAGDETQHPTPLRPGPRAPSPRPPADGGRGSQAHQATSGAAPQARP